MRLESSRCAELRKLLHAYTLTLPLLNSLLAIENGFHSIGDAESHQADGSLGAAAMTAL